MFSSQVVAVSKKVKCLFKLDHGTRPMIMITKAAMKSQMTAFWRPVMGSTSLVRSSMLKDFQSSSRWAYT